MQLDTIKKYLQQTSTIAVVGLSPKENRPSNMVARYLIEEGFEVIPVNPGQNEILGKKCYPTLSEVKHQIDIVDIFRNPADVLPIVEEAIAIGAGCVWMQQGIINKEAARLAEEHGVFTVMDRCLKIDHQNLKKYL